MKRLHFLGLTLVLASPLAAQWTEGGASIGANLDNLVVTFQGMGTLFSLSPFGDATDLYMTDTSGLTRMSIWGDGASSGAQLNMYDATGTSTITLRAGSTGDASVVFPQDAIASEEILDEPGVAGTGFGSSQSIPSGNSAILSQSIVAPDSGYLFVIASGEVGVNHANGSMDNAYFGVNVGDSVLPANQQITVLVPSALPTANYYYPVTPNGIFQVGPGTHTVYFGASVFSGTYSVDDVQLSVIYIPTAYGTVAKSARKTGEDAAGIFVRPSVQAERQMAEQANQARIQAELQKIRQRLAELEAEMRSTRTR